MNKLYQDLQNEIQNITQEASAFQRQASDPRYSVWVSASAGTGKTRVLTNRVLRLLLDGVPSHRILCITFTNAAASEMSDRIQEDLAHWATLDDEPLTQILHHLTGEKPTDNHKQKAKQLFAEVLESPGGMRIQTIHSFCQQILGRFPVEAGIPPNFSITDEMQSNALLAEARNEVMNLAESNNHDPQKSNPLSEAVNTLLLDGSEYELTELLNKARYYRREILDLVHLHSYEKIKTLYADFLNISPQTNLEALTKDYLQGFEQRTSQIKQLMHIFYEKGGKNEKEKYADILDQFLSYPEKREDFLHQFIEIFLTKEHAPRQRFPTKAVLRAFPEAEKIIQLEQEKILHFIDQKASFLAFIRSVALTRLSGEVLVRWERNKLKHMLLDYDDLIHYTAALLKKDLSWVHYKLDEGIDHILVDEAQDTNPRQWQIISKLAEEFFDDIERNNHQHRTLFVVGDFKQSIYSFQGAKPQEFIKQKEFFAQKTAQAYTPFRSVNLDTNFRSIPPILEITDQIITYSARDGVLHHTQKQLIHKPVRLLDHGNVEIWPLIEKEETEKFEFTFSPQPENNKSNIEKMAEAVATHIKTLLNQGYYLSSKKRACEPKDFLILVRRRHPFVQPLIRALNAQDIKTAGADRLNILEQIAVQDLLALARFMLQPADDYSLACILRSPLFEISEEALLHLSYQRKNTLFNRLKDKQSESLYYQSAYDQLVSWRKTVDFHTVFEFFSSILAKGQYDRMVMRLGEEAKDAINEFLDFCLSWESQNPPLLENFMRAIDTGKIEIKREHDDGFNAVRIMTVHGSKGLQAPIVFLPDCDESLTNIKSEIQLHPLESNNLLLWSKDRLPEVMTLYKDEQKTEQIREHNRLLYVALTRAEDKLIIGGYQKSKQAVYSWYNHIQTALQQDIKTHYIQKEVQYSYLPDKSLILCSPYDYPIESTPKNIDITTIQYPEIPPHLYMASPKEKYPYSPLTPGHIMEDSTLPARSPLDAIRLDQLFNRGIIIHKLLELLPQIEKKHWDQTLLNFLQKPSWQLSKQQQKQISYEVLKVLNHPEFQDIFRKEALAEVPISGIINEQIISGRIDRLLIKKNEILLVDFKTNRPPPSQPQDVALIYLKQLRIYKQLLAQIWPNKPIRCALLWTDICTLMPMDEFV